MRPILFAPVVSAFWLAACSEQVDAYFYPDRGDLTQSEARIDVGSVEACRDWAYARAAQIGDPNMQRSDYECGLGPKEHRSGFTVYRETIR